MIYFVEDQNSNTLVKEYLTDNKIDFCIWDKWKFEQGKSIFVLPSGKFLLIMPYSLLKNLDILTFVQDLKNSDGILYLCSNLESTGNYLWCREYFEDVENVFFHQEGWINYSEPRTVTYNFFTWSFMLDQITVHNDYNRNKDFLLTTIVKNTERQKLVSSLEHRQLLNNFAGRITTAEAYAQFDRQNFDAGKLNNWVGLHQGHYWPDGTVSWDLYNSACYELVPETYYSDVTLLTEKIFKPIIARMPFIVLGDPMFYRRLHESGFETFSNTIDESFADEQDIDKRIDRLTKTMLHTDPQEFYYNTRELCEHNFNNLCIQHHRGKIEFQNQLHKFLLQKG